MNHTVPAVNSLCCPLWWTDSITLFFTFTLFFFIKNGWMDDFLSLTYNQLKFYFILNWI